MELIGNSAQIARINTMSKQIALTDSNVLISGEHGSGKGLIAQIIHNNSTRNNKPYITINCAILNVDAMSRALFGYEEGTDVTRGALEKADGGTIFLKEIDSMPIELQKRLLYFLQTQKLVRINGNETIFTDVRIIVATTQNLETMVCKQNFLIDLYNSLATDNINVPTLRERREDIPLLIEHILDQILPLMPICEFAQEVMHKFMTYKWPGNILELINTIERLCIMYPKQMITINHLPKEFTDVRSNLFNMNQVVIVKSDLATKSFDLKDHLEKI
ncbi:sigma-54-dependent Fis family transcriptional regulator, partial [Candidatus Saccharibacteria bacterium]|nr:sigma-54-dependent Fis family transcriptional regulator [Candidatus Saccharibacteria bacterium]